jgi:hypothetical protein
MNEVPHDDVWGREGMAPPFLTSALDQDGFMHCPLHPWGKSLLFLLDRKLVGPQSWSAYCEEKNLSLLEIDPS